MEHIKPILNIFKTHNILLYILFVSSTVITFDLFGLRKVLGIDLIGQPYIAIIGMLFLICLASFVFLTVSSIYGNLITKIKEKIQARSFKKELEKNIRNLSDREIVIILLYFMQDSDTIWLPLQGAEVTSLVRKKIIFLSQVNGRNMTNGMQIFHFSTFPDVKEQFEENYPQFFGDEVDVRKVNNFIKNNTPSYIYEMNEMNRRWNIY
ncbi:super-infection exclusion protein B [Acinetobacter baumannii]|uniref:super-infection exclusion protein B n=1 Tax=Acinetobacter baumannii TaxID=470 RepID=UPI0024468B71|nr:super-infection exclusion protein B [Acinetobacter baumannii]MDH2570019.1 super-infection exclusion protein B [Acinetobacter baumannii]